MTRELLAFALALVATVSLTVEGTWATFNNQASVTSGAYASTKIDLTTSPSSALLSFTGMVPNDSTTASVVVTNATGSAALRYAISSSATDADGKGLKDQLTLVVKTVDVTTPGTPCDNFDGSQLYSGDLDSTAGKLVGDSAQGAQTGDRSLAVGASETLCFRATLPGSTGSGFTSAATTATFTFDAEQTANNP